jgi:hypothetical protein
VSSPIVTPRRRRRQVGCVGLLIAFGILVFVASMMTVLIAVAIWPGEAKLTAPLFCPDDQPDAFVVVDSYSVQPGETSYNFTLYCMGPRGEVTDVGFFLPCLVLTIGHALLVLLVVGGLVLWLRRRNARRPIGGPDVQFTPSGPEQGYQRDADVEPAG